MSHQHSHAPNQFGRAFALGVALNVGFVVAETAGGLWSGSLALLADAGHNLSDVLGLLLAWGALLLARRPPTPRRTYGFRRSSILAALFNACLLLVAVGGIGWEAFRRLLAPPPLAGWTVIAIAAAGVAVNGFTAALFLGGQRHDVNIRGAFLHMAADAAVSLGVVVTAVVMLATGWNWLDPVVSLAIALAILVGTWDLLAESLNLALDAAPRGIDPQAIGEYLAAAPGVREVHDLHVWGLSTTEAALTAHLVVDLAESADELLARLSRELHSRFDIEHATIQLESGANGCPTGLACERPPCR